MNQKRVLLIGARAGVLKSLTERLQTEGYHVQWTKKYKKVIDDFWKSEFDLVAFGRGVSEVEKDKIKGVFSTKNSKTIFIEGLAPIIPLLAYQIKSELNKDNEKKVMSGFSLEEDGNNFKIALELSEKAHVKIVQYRQDFFYRTHAYHFLDTELNKGPYAITVERKKSKSFLVVDVNGTEIFIKPM